MGQRQALRAELVRLFGVPDEIRGRWFYEHGERFSNGVLLLWGTIVGRESGIDSDDLGDSTCCVDVPGSAIDDLEPGERIAILGKLTIGGRVSRIDLAADAFHSEAVGLIDRIIESCSSGELCGARRWASHVQFDGLEVCGYGVTIGGRGKYGSGRYVRVYDKGIETQTQERGRWERLEVEFSGDAAAEVAADVFASSGVYFEDRAWARINGAVDFREDKGSNGELARRPRCEWWASWMGGILPSSTVVRRVAITLERHTAWLKSVVLPTVARLAVDAGMPFTDALVELCGPAIEPRRTCKYMRSMLACWREHLRGVGLVAAT